MHFLDCIKYGAEQHVQLPDTDDDNAIEMVDPILEPIPEGSGPVGDPPTYSMADMERFISMNGSEALEDAIEKYWLDVRDGTTATLPFGEGPGILLFDHNERIHHHLIYAYLVENTGLVDVMSEFIGRFQHDESLTKVGLVNGINIHDLMENTEQLFFKDGGSRSINSNITSNVRPDAWGTRANAYHRLLGMRARKPFRTVGNIQPLLPTEGSNGTFIAAFERFLKLFWEAYTNVNNRVGQNFTDMFAITQSLQDLRLMLMARRSADATFTASRYAEYHLSRVEFNSVNMMFWLRYLINPGSSLTQYMRLDGNTSGDVLLQLGERLFPRAKYPTPVVHSKCQALFDLADVIADFLRSAEMGLYEPVGVMDRIIDAHDNALATAQNRADQTSLLSIIHNWHLTTGIDIKGDRQRMLQRA